MAQTPSAGRVIKWPTHLAATGDVDLSYIRSDNFTHFMDGVIFDNTDNPVCTELSVWGRLPPDEATFLLNNVSMATHPLRLAVSDAVCMRQVPKEIDGSDREAPSLPNTMVYVTGVAVVESTDGRRKEGIFVGTVYMGRALAWVPFKVRGIFEDSPRYQSWTISSPRSLVGFEGVLHSVESDGTPVIHIRRLSFICEAPRPLLQELGIGQTMGGDRAAKRADLRQASKAKRSRTECSSSGAEGSFSRNEGSSSNQTTDHGEFHEDDNVAGPSTPTRGSSKFSVKQSPTKAGTPSSPTIGLLTRKRSRAENL